MPNCIVNTWQAGARPALSGAPLHLSVKNLENEIITIIPQYQAIMHIIPGFVHVLALLLTLLKRITYTLQNPAAIHTKFIRGPRAYDPEMGR